jgi:hypothetical protein
VEIVVSTHHLGLGGSESYLLTVAEQLQRLGHGVTVFAGSLGPGAEIGRARGLEIQNREDELPETCDVVFSNESVTAYKLAERYSTTPQVYALHAETLDLSVPPQLPGLVQAVVVLHDRVDRRAQALAHVPELVRLRQPVDTERFRPRGALRNPARRVLLLGNYVTAERRDLVLRACEAEGLECVQLGATSSVTVEPEHELCRADIVIGKGRAIVEAMACGRAAYVYDLYGGDGWVTPERYGLLAADNFGGQAEATATDLARLRRDLEAYSPEMGPANRDLAVANHSATRHAQELVTLFQRLSPQARHDATPLRELSRLVRLQWASELRAEGWAAEAHRLGTALEEVTAERNELARELRRAGTGEEAPRAGRARAVARKLGARRVKASLLRLTSFRRGAEKRAHTV